jgi:D-glycero-alpha-D-manno-heptose-7-phosphate kinase
MIISRTPFRLSFFGGGTDYPVWYRKHGGAVLATTFNKYCYLTCRYLPPFFEHKIRLVYSKIENCKTIDEIKHPAVRAVLEYLKMDRGLEIHHDGDLPARSGMGSSSSFIVGLLHAIYALKGKMPNKHRLAMESIEIEQSRLKETVGSQDQVSASYGGFNHISFMPNGEIFVRPITISRERIQELNSHLMLFYTGIKRTASNIAESYIHDLESKKRQLRISNELLEESISILTNEQDLKGFGELLHEAWQAKKSLSPSVSNSQVDDIYQLALSAGAVGGKLTGAGGGGFLLLFAYPETQKKIREKLKKLIYIPFKFEFSGSQIIFFDGQQENFSDIEKEIACQPIEAFQELCDVSNNQKKKTKTPNKKSRKQHGSVNS